MKTLSMKWILSIVLLSWLQIGFAQEKYNKVHTFTSDAFGVERTVRVYLPKRYFKDTTTQFAVTYVLDAQSDEFWDMAKGNIGYLVRSYEVIPMIVVGISSPNRYKDFTPPANKLLTHFEKEVFPLIQENYRVNDFKTIIGHSWAGSFMGYTLFSEYFDLFDAYINISPSFQYKRNALFPKADSVLQHRKVFQKYVYASVGDLGGIEFYIDKALHKMDSLVQQYPNPTLQWDFEIFDKADHWSTVIPAMNQGLMGMSRNYMIDHSHIQQFIATAPNRIYEQIQDFYKKQQTNLGYTHTPSPIYIRFLADDYRDEEQYDTALQIYQWAIAEAPEEITINMNIADTYDQMGNRKKAKKALKKVIRLLNEQQSDLKPDFYQNCMKWAKERLNK